MAYTSVVPLCSQFKKVARRELKLLLDATQGELGSKPKLCETAKSMCLQRVLLKDLVCEWIMDGFTELRAGLRMGG